MTQHIYISSPSPLSTGSFGLNPVSPEQPNVYATELDFAHIHFEDNWNEKQQRRTPFSSHLTYEYQVALWYGIPVKRGVRRTPEEEKCLRLLYQYVEEALQQSGVVEYFASWHGEEEDLLLKWKTVRWEEIQTPYDLVLEDRELWTIVRE
ncbi:hypothetical protein [Ectobacillus ponti]|uniref:Uncharacterized protein n=1 Tax=Ectobacillus ponti TaxID=2961894 RepID=A0AA42BR70_9BACI|nr:hypothetical protein [Ectobacillus ponti]MCP8971035.1 hypothetical protein [Ectobacillus ponti]